MKFLKNQPDDFHQVEYSILQNGKHFIGQKRAN